MEIKAIACDVDGTLTGHSHWVSLDAIQVIRSLEADGLPVILVTSRDYETAGWLSVYLGACGIVVAEDGTLFGDFRSDEPPVLLGDCAKIKHSLTVLCEVLGDQMNVWMWPGRICSAVLQLANGTSVDQGNAILAERGVLARLVDFGPVCVLNDVSVNKGTGLQEAAKMLDIQPENIVAIGDNFNDIDMFAVAGYSIAVGNAPQAVKDQVDYACKACFGEGFCEGVEHALACFYPRR